MLFHQRPNVKAPPPLPASRLKVHAITDVPMYLPSVLSDPAVVWDLPLLGREAEVQPSHVTSPLLPFYPWYYLWHPRQRPVPGLWLSHFLISSILLQTASISSRMREMSSESGHVSLLCYRGPQRINRRACLPTHKVYSFLSNLPDALNNYYPTVWHFALWALNSGHSVFSTEVTSIYVFIMRTSVHGAFRRYAKRTEVNDGFVHSPASGHDFNSVFLAALTPSSADNHSLAIMRHLTANLVFFSKFLSHCHFPFYPHSISPPSWSLYHCHSPTNLPATAASPHTTFLTANLCSGRTHPSSGSLRCAAPSPAALRCTPSRTDSQVRTSSVPF